MIGLFRFVLAVLASPFKSKLRLEAENAVLRLQLIILRRRLHGRVRLTNHDRWFFIQLYRWFPSILKVLTIIRPEAFPWNEAPRYMIRDRDRIYGAVVTRGLRATGIRTSYRTILALAEWVCRAADRIEPPRALGPRYCPGRGASAPILRSYADYCTASNSSILGQGCAGLPPGSANWCDQFTRRLGRTSSPLRPCLSFRYTQ